MLFIIYFNTKSAIIIIVLKFQYYFLIIINLCYSIFYNKSGNWLCPGCDQVYTGAFSRARNFDKGTQGISLLTHIMGDIFYQTVNNYKNKC